MTKFTCTLCSISFEKWVLKAIHDYQEHNIPPWVGDCSPQNAPHEVEEGGILQMDNIEVDEGERATQNMINDVLQMYNKGY